MSGDIERRGLVFWSVWSAALVLNLAISASLPGTSDIQFYGTYGDTFARFGVARAYASNEIFNIPPMAAGFAALLSMAFGPGTMLFAFFFRLPGILGEAAISAILWKTKRCPAAVAALAVLNPLSLAITGYHGNLDGLLAVFVSAALLSAASNRPVACGIWLGLATNLKVAPVLIGPAFFFWWFRRGSTLRFTTAVVLTTIAGWSPALIECPGLFASRVLSYSSVWGQWGISRLLYLTNADAFHTITYGTPSRIAGSIAAALKLIVLATATAFAWRRRKEDAHGLIGTVAMTWTLFLVLTPAGAPQYLIWPLLPLLLYEARLGIWYAVSAIPALAIYYLPLTAFLLPGIPIAEWVETSPYLSGAQGWAGPALCLWGCAVAILILRFPNCWSLNNDQSAAPRLKPDRPV